MGFALAAVQTPVPGEGQLSIFCQSCFKLTLIGQQPGSKNRWDNQTGSRGEAMRTGELWEGGSPFLPSSVQTQKKQDVTHPTEKGTVPCG